MSPASIVFEALLDINTGVCVYGVNVMASATITWLYLLFTVRLRDCFSSLMSTLIAAICVFAAGTIISSGWEWQCTKLRSAIKLLLVYLSMTYAANNRPTAKFSTAVSHTHTCQLPICRDNRTPYSDLFVCYLALFTVRMFRRLIHDTHERCTENFSTKFGQVSVSIMHLSRTVPYNPIPTRTYVL